MYKEGIKVARLLKSINKRLHKNISERFNDCGFTVPQIMVVATLFKNKKMKISELSKAMQLSNSTVSAMINGLENRNVIRRVKSDKDRRVTYIELEDGYKKIAEQLYEEVEIYLQNIIEKATDEKVESIIIGLKNLQELLENQDIIHSL
ncbi:MarR family transcriptional regulator [Clostridium bovifaecis]|uniref:MarR family transcriptional regulator n=1 Tax=Clostridium bovifaecis TaxID=2184719 RepID=A0A6I6EQ60_9CLOT|nr:MarR family transcriptional regulator [Clostridium bovifaecis]